MSNKNVAKQTNIPGVNQDILASVDEKRDEQLVWVSIDNIIGYDDAPDPKKAFRESVAAHQMYPVALNYNSKTKQYEMIDGRGRTIGRSEEGREEVLAIIYKNLTVLEKAALSRIPHEGRRENYIHLYHATKAFLAEGVDPVEIQDKRLRMKKSLYAKIQRIDDLIPQFKDAFLSNDPGFGFARAQKVAKLTEVLQNDLLAIYNDEGKITNDDIRKVKQVKASQDIKEMFSPELLKQLEARKEWKPEVIELIRRLDVVCPADDELRTLLNPLIKKAPTLSE